MPRYVYSVLRFVPNPASGEFVNIGAIAGSDELRDWSVRVVSSHKRAKKLDERGVIAHVFEHVEKVEDLCAPDDDDEDGAEHAPGMSEPALWRLFGDWQSIVQLSEPTPIAADSAESALEAVFTQQILDPGRRERVYRTKLQARAMMLDAYRRGGVSDRGLVKRGAMVKPPHHPVRFDFAVANGRAVQLAQTWSFEIPEAENIAAEVRAWGWGVRELRRGGATMQTDGEALTVLRDVDIQVLYVPANHPGGERAWEEAQSVFADVNVRTVPAADADRVAARAVELLDAAAE